MTYTLVMKSIAAQRFGEDDNGRSDQLSSNIAFLDKKPRNGLISADTPCTNKPTLPSIQASRKEYRCRRCRKTIHPHGTHTRKLSSRCGNSASNRNFNWNKLKLAEFKSALGAETVAYTNNQANESRQPQLYGSVKQEQPADYSHPQKSSVSIPT